MTIAILTKHTRITGRIQVFFLSVLISTTAAAQNALPPLPAPLGVPKPGPATDAPYAPQPILPGGVVVTIYPPGSPFLKMDRVREPEQYNMSQTVPGRISSIVNIHNPSIEVHTVDRGLNTGAAVILVAGGGHNTLNVGSEGADFVPFFYNYGVNTVILRNRLRRDGYNPQTDEVYDAQQAIRLVRAHAKEWNIDPNKIGIMGFSAGAELAAAGGGPVSTISTRRTATPAIRWPESRRALTSSASSIRDPRPSPATALLRRSRATFLPPSSPAAARTIAVTPSGPMEYFAAMLAMRVPNIEMHIYGNGRHPGDPLARRQPHDRRPDRSQRYPLRHLAVPLHRLVPRSGISAEAGHGNQSGQRHRTL